MAATLLKTNSVTVAAQDDAATVSGIPSAGIVGVQIAGTFSGTITFEGSVDGTNFRAINMTPSNSTTAATTATTVGIWVSGNAGAYSAIRARCSAYTSGSPVVTIRYCSQ